MTFEDKSLGQAAARYSSENIELRALLSDLKQELQHALVSDTPIEAIKALLLKIKNTPSHNTTITQIAPHQGAAQPNPQKLLEQIYGQLDPEQSLLISPLGLEITDDEFAWFVIGLACAQSGFLGTKHTAAEKYRLIQTFASAQGINETAANNC